MTQKASINLGSESNTPRHNSLQQTLAVIARWIERDCLVDHAEAMRMLARAVRAHGKAVAEAWRAGRLHAELAAHGDSYRLELVIGRQTLV